MDKTLYVCVSPVLLSGSYYDGYDYSSIGALADEVILMAYDYEARDMSDFVGTEYYKTAATVPLDQVFRPQVSGRGRRQDRAGPELQERGLEDRRGREDGLRCAGDRVQ